MYTLLPCRTHLVCQYMSYTWTEVHVDAGGVVINHHDFIQVAGDIPIGIGGGAGARDPFICFLYWSGHYDILYAKLNAPTLVTTPISFSALMCAVLVNVSDPSL